MAIEHVFAVMLENRSFDHMLGWSQISGTDVQTKSLRAINGASTSNSNAGSDGTSYNQQSADTNPAPSVMNVDPGHEFPDVLEQLTTTVLTAPPLPGGIYPPINMKGFVTNFEKALKANGVTESLNDIMNGFPKSQLPVLTTLAQEFCVFDNWFSSIPGPTWPNRFFFHAATSGGWDHSLDDFHMAWGTFISGFSFEHGNIFQSLTKAGLNWAIYSDDAIPQVRSLAGISNSDIRPFSSFASDISSPNYEAAYTFIEPNYGHEAFPASYQGGTSQHPMDNVASGDAFLGQIYNALIASPLWDRSLLIILYDEHGGLYDHVSPPAGVPPNDTPQDDLANSWNFKFNLLGVRVPAVLVSPLIPRNIIDGRNYDHAAWPATIRKIFGIKQQLTNRDAYYYNNGQTLDMLASLTTPRSDIPGNFNLPAGSSSAALSETAGILEKTKFMESPQAAAPPKGNSLGFLHTAMMMQAESVKPSEQPVLANGVRSIKTQRQAYQFIDAVRSKMLAQRSAGKA